mmetsp:Transcript_20801/g.52416  ORF Transcript_20801/g.52416 Transcript_20801/m.52416 type:complete len:228 (-) Transcript_20801:1960-2643(-)
MNSSIRTPAVRRKRRQRATATDYVCRQHRALHRSRFQKRMLEPCRTMAELVDGRGRASVAKSCRSPLMGAASVMKRRCVEVDVEFGNWRRWKIHASYVFPDLQKRQPEKIAWTAHADSFDAGQDRLDARGFLRASSHVTWHVRLSSTRLSRECGVSCALTQAARSGGATAISTCTRTPLATRPSTTRFRPPTRSRRSTSTETRGRTRRRVPRPQSAARTRRRIAISA